MNEATKIELPYPPSANTYYRHIAINGHPRTLLSKKGREYRRIVASLLAVARSKPTERPVAVTLAVNPPDNRRRDLDNILKSLLDALEYGGAYKDDSQIEELHIMRCEVQRPLGRVVVFIQER